ncbi:ubiquitin elongating factor core-domain-containing protein [Gaertneriomyces semiglobifer]|nr:ubiquitin elongating factor core-domain-containing protein [Gaertneriomyces semiglobifer]
MKRLAKLNAAATDAPRSTSANEQQHGSVSQSKEGSLKEKNQSPLSPKPKSSAVPSSISKPSTSPSSSSHRIADAFVSKNDDVWENEAFEYVFHCTLSLEVSSRKQYVYLADVLVELEREASPPLITSEHAERALYARLSLPQNASPDAQPLFDYLVASWRRCNETKAQVSAILEKGGNRPELKHTAQHRLGAVDGVKNLISNYAALLVNPDMTAMFPQPQRITELGPAYLASKLLASDAYEAEETLPREFFDSLLARLEGEDYLDQIVSQIVNSIVAQMREQNIAKDYQTPLRAMTTLVSYKPIAAAIPRLSNWNPATMNAKTIEVLPILGPFLSRLSAFPDADPTIADHYFASSDPFGEGHARLDGVHIGSRNPGDVRATMESLRGVLESAERNLFNITMNIVKSGPNGKESVLSFLARIISLNKRRGRMQFDPREVSSNAFVFNAVQLGLRFCEPIMEPKYSKLHLIDPDYFNHSQRIDISDSTRINAEKDVWERDLHDWQQANPNPQPPNFVSDVFYLTLALHHYGLISIMRQYSALVKQIENLRKQVDKMKAERDSGAWQGHHRMNGQLLKRFQEQLDKAVAFRLSMETSLRDRAKLEVSMRFYNLAMMWLLRCASIGSSVIRYPAEKSADHVDWASVARGGPGGLSLNTLPERPPKPFSALPEWIIEDICEFFLFIGRFDLPFFENNPRDEFLTFSSTLLGNPQYVKNPHLKSHLVEILYTFTWPLWRTQSGELMGRLDDVFSTHPLARAHLVSNLMRFYVDVEHTGVSSQFYDKFNIRYNISQILKKIWGDPSHRSKIVEKSQDLEFFVRFVALLMNDTTYLLDESLSKLKQIQQLQHELTEPLPANASQAMIQRREERNGLLQQLEDQALSYMSLGNETVHMLQYMTADSEIVQPFMAAEIVERLAAMLDYNLAALVGPRCTELKVKDPAKYRFDPKSLLKELIEIYLHLAHRTEFIEAVAKDQRSYDKRLFTRASDILKRNMLKSETELEDLLHFVQKVEDSVRSSQAEDEELGEIPEEFTDPLLYHLMEDPVILPGSGVSIDRSTIKTHLLSDAHDPFNRQPLSIEEVVPNEELRIRIQEWRGSRRGRVQANPVPMDTDS